MLEIKNLVKNFEATHAVDDLSFSIKPGEIFGLLGPNGAGKTTTLRMLMDILKPDSGEILFQDVPRSKVSKQSFGYLPEERGLYQPARVQNLLVYIGLLNKLSKHRAEIEAIRQLDKLGLIDYTQHRVNELSKGLQQKLQFITATIHDPEVLILDEPFVGLDPVNQIILRDIIQQYKTEGKIVLLSTHQMEEVERLCDRICLLNQGKVILEGSIPEIKKRFRENAFFIEVEEDISFIHNIKSIKILEEHNRSCKISVMGKNANIKNILHEISDNLTIKKFVQVEPTLNDIFIKLLRSEPSKRK